jgi:hypothetical protein
VRVYDRSEGLADRRIRSGQSRLVKSFEGLPNRESFPSAGLFCPPITRMGANE